MASPSTRAQQILSIGILSLATSTVALGQEKPVEKISVVGTHLLDFLSEGTSRVQIIDRTRIDQSGKLTLAEILQDIPQNNAGAFSEAFVAGFAPGGAGVSLRGLGQKSTLVLINGRRIANYGFAQSLQENFVDLNSIPLSAVERVEILTDGASALYGADAIGGVVNIVLYKKYSGLEVTLNGSRGQEQGGEEARTSVHWGGNWAQGRLNASGAIEVFHREQLKYSDRKWTKDFDFRGFPGGALGRFTEAAYIFPNATSRMPFPSCREETRNASDLNPILSGTLCTYNPASLLTAMPASDRASFWATGELTLGHKVAAFGNILTSRVETEQIGVPTTLANNSVTFDASTGGVLPIRNVLLGNNPSNPFGVPVRIQYTFFDVGPRITKTTSDTHSGVLGIRSEIAGFDIEAAATSARNEVTSLSRNNVDAQALISALSVGDYNFVSPSQGSTQADSIRLDATRNSTSRASSFDLKVSSPVAMIGSSEARLVAGAERRRESLADKPDSALSSGRVLGRGSSEASGKRSITSAFLEGSVSYQKIIEGQVALRFDRYSDVGSATSPKIGIRWNANQMVSLRGSYSRGFRAPSLQEAANSSALFFDLVSDPEFDGRPSQIAALSRGNPDLKPERSTGTNIGIVIRPTNAFTASIDAYVVKQRNLISADSFQFIVDQAFDGNPQFAGAVQRDLETGVLRSVSATFRNLDAVETRGVDVDASWFHTIPNVGKIFFDAGLNYVSHFRQRPDPGSEVMDFVDSNGFVSMPRYKAILRGGIDRQRTGASLTFRYIPSYDQTFSDDQSRIARFRDLDVSAYYNVSKSIRVSASIQNLLNSRPPFDASSLGGLDFEQHSLRGRFFSLGLKAKF